MSKKREEMLKQVPYGTIKTILISKYEPDILMGEKEVLRMYIDEESKLTDRCIRYMQETAHYKDQKCVVTEPTIKPKYGVSIITKDQQKQLNNLLKKVNYNGDQTENKS